MASKEDLEEIIGEYSAKLGIPVPSIVWTKGIDLATLSGELLYISAEVLEAMSVSNMRVEVGYAYARRVQARYYLKVFLMGLLGLTIWVLASYYTKVYAREHGTSLWTSVLGRLPLIGSIAFMMFAYHIGNRAGDSIAYGLSQDVEGVKRFLATKGRTDYRGKCIPLDPKALARRTAQLEVYVQSQVVGESKP